MPKTLSKDLDKANRCGEEPQSLAQPVQDTEDSQPLTPPLKTDLRLRYADLPRSDKQEPQSIWETPMSRRELGHLTKNTGLAFIALSFAGKLLTACSPDNREQDKEDFIRHFLYKFDPHQIHPFGPESQSGDYPTQSLENDITSEEIAQEFANVTDITTFIEFLEKYQNYQSQLSELILADQLKAAGFINQVTSIDQLIEIFRIIPKDPELFKNYFIEFSLEYLNQDTTLRDTFRPPIETLNSGWADCDDFLVLNYFWAHMHGYKPNIVILNDGDESVHTLLWYRDEEGQLVILDDQYAFVLPSDRDPDEVISNAWRDEGLYIYLNFQIPEL